MSMTFPYYIVRFKPEYPWSFGFRFLRFPYYIVRFKLVSNILPYLVLLGFHTTQYDLNKLYRRRKPGKTEFPYYIVRFKRTMFFFGFRRKKKFPYYIVRFKQRHCGTDYFRIFWFPYYIVRFKLWMNDQKTEHIISFHTTQYDLNSVEGKYIPLLYTGFHTTQYDLN